MLISMGPGGSYGCQKFEFPAIVFALSLQYVKKIQHFHKNLRKISQSNWIQK